MVSHILLQTTIPTHPDDWAIERFSLLQNYLASLTDANGDRLFEVTARDRQPDDLGNDPILSQRASPYIAVIDLMRYTLTSPQTPLHLSLTLSCKERGEEVYFY
jgi:hypothetical protein